MIANAPPTPVPYPASYANQEENRRAEDRFVLVLVGWARRMQQIDSVLHDRQEAPDVLNMRGGGK